MIENVIENLVVKAHLHQKLPLQTLSVSIPETEFDEQDPVLIFRFENPKRAVIITEQGAIICTGVTSLLKGQETIYAVIETLQRHGISLSDKPEIGIQSFVLSGQFDKTLDLDHISRQLHPDQLIYNPKKNPWIEYLYDDEVTLLICSSGTIVCTGTSSLDHAQHAIDMLSTIDGIKDDD